MGSKEPYNQPPLSVQRFAVHPIPSGNIPILSLTTPTSSEWSLLALLGLVATIGHLLVAFAYQRAPVSILAPFQYVEIIGATLLGLWLFNDFPDPITWLGVGIIVASGIYVFHRESRIQTEEKQAQ